MKKVLIFLFSGSVIFLVHALSVHAFISEDDYAALRRDLQEGSLAEKRKVLREIERSGLPDEDSRYLLAPALDDDDARIKLAAAGILIASDDSEAERVIFSFLENPTELRTNKVCAVRVLERYGTVSMIERLLNMLAEEADPMVQLAILEALVRSHKAYADASVWYPVMKRLLADPHVSVRTQAVSAAEYFGSAAADLLRGVLDDPAAGVFEKAFALYTVIAPADVEAVMRAYLDDENDVRVVNAAFALVALGHTAQARYITLRLMGDDSRVRLQTLSFLKRKVGVGSHEPFMSAIQRIALYDNDEKVRNAAKEYLVFSARANASQKNAMR